MNTLRMSDDGSTHIAVERRKSNELYLNTEIRGCRTHNGWPDCLAEHGIFERAPNYRQTKRE